MSNDFTGLNFAGFQSILFEIEKISFRSLLSCSVLCEKSNDCTAFSYQEKTQSCQLGVREKSVASTLTSSTSMLVYKKSGFLLLKVT